jgi:hypothetical protein
MNRLVKTVGRVPAAGWVDPQVHEGTRNLPRDGSRAQESLIKYHVQEGLTTSESLNQPAQSPHHARLNLHLRCGSTVNR